jgi:hypothetical protein
MKLNAFTSLLLLANDTPVHALPFNLKPAFTGLLSGLASLRDPRGFQGFNNAININQQPSNKVPLLILDDLALGEDGQLVPDVVKTISKDLGYSLPDICNIEESIYFMRKQSYLFTLNATEVSD